MKATIKERYISNVKETSINVINSNLDSLRFKNDIKTTFRIYKDGFIGVKGAIGTFNEKKLEKEAIEALNCKIEYPFNPTENKQKCIDKRSKFVKEDNIVTETDDFLYALRIKYPDFIFSNELSLKETTTKLLNDKGLSLEYNDKSFNTKLLFKHKSSSNSFDGHIVTEERRYDRSLLLNEISIILNAYTNKVDLPQNATYPVIFMSSMLPISKFISDLDANLYTSGNSLFSNKIEQKLFNENFSLYQSLNPDDVINKPFFDAEGIINNEYRYPIIEKGILKAAYTDKGTSHKYNLPLTGSAISLYNEIPELGYINYKILESQNTLKALLSGDIGILVIMSPYENFTPNGDYSAKVQLSFLFDGEKLLGRLPEIELTSNIYDMFGSCFRGISKDTFMPFSTSKFGVMDLNVRKV